MSNFILTITGADDDIDPKDLTDISKEFPFVEWGILFSESQNGQKRYPSKLWREALYARCMSSDFPVNISAHVCGKMTDRVLEQQDLLVSELDIFYRRIQFNRTNDSNQKALLKYISGTSTQCILPFNTNTKSVLESDIGDLTKRISILYDASGGRGVSPDVWPEHNNNFLRCGYAGGINEENVEKHLETLTKRYGQAPFWIDLETGARDMENNFSLDIVNRILMKASRYHALTKGKAIQLKSSSIILS